MAWARFADAIEEPAALRLIRLAAARPGDAAAVFARAIVLREAVYRVFWAVAHDQPPPPDDFVTLQREHAAGVVHAAIAATVDGFAWTWPEAGPDDGAATLSRPLWPIARSATELLTGGDPTRVKVCPGAPGNPVACAWLFYDATKNRSRHWCSMDDCGAVTKARHQTGRRRAARAARPS